MKSEDYLARCSKGGSQFATAMRWVRRGDWKYLCAIFFILHSSFFISEAAAQIFPYPSIPDSIEEPQERIAFMLEHFWRDFDFEKTVTAEGRMTAEQGFVDFINLLQHTDSLTAERCCRLLADSLTTPARETLFSDFTERYLGNPYSPMRNDVSYAHLLRSLPETPERTYLLKEVTKNQVGMKVADIEGLYAIQSPLTLLVFYDPQCYRCQALIARIEEQKERMTGVHLHYINTEEVPEANEAFYLPSLPALYLLDQEKRVLVKDGSLEEIEQRIAQ